MTRPAIVATLIGLTLAATLLATNDLPGIVAALRHAGWAIVIVVALHMPQTLFSALGWGRLIERDPPPAPGLLYRLRWVRESVNALLPVAQIGGDVVRARLIARRGVPLPLAAASSVADLSLEMATQIVFTLFGIALLLGNPRAGDLLPLAGGVAVAGGAVAVTFVAAQRFGLFRLIERGAARWFGGGFAGLAGVHEALAAIYRRPRRLWVSSGWHLASWLFGCVETYAALRVLGIGASLRDAAVIESLAHAVRGLGFLVPGALGVQEGGYVLICAMFGIAPAQALALSLVRRIRELALGLPGLIAWHRMERPAPPQVASGAPA